MVVPFPSILLARAFVTTLKVHLGSEDYHPTTCCSCSPTQILMILIASNGPLLPCTRLGWGVGRRSTGFLYGNRWEASTKAIQCVV
uniref:U113-Liphistoxin-Lsp1a_1 n=1 Tax=Liphistius sp. SGP-2016 TaxID=1905180 RepID=A0A4Q8K7F8_9ARAC